MDNGEYGPRPELQAMQATLSLEQASVVLIDAGALLMRDEALPEDLATHYAAEYLSTLFDCVDHAQADWEICADAMPAGETPAISMGAIMHQAHTILREHYENPGLPGHDTAPAPCSLESAEQLLPGVALAQHLIGEAYSHWVARQV